MTIEQELEQIDAQYANAFNTGDAATLANLYTDNGLLLSPGSPEQRGRKAVAAAFKEGIESGWKNISFASLETGSDGALAYRVGTYDADAPNEDGTTGKVNGKYVEIYKRQTDGSWKIQVTISYSD